MKQPVARIACLGCGTIGASWAALFLAHGHDVALWDPSRRRLDELGAMLGQSLGDLERMGLDASRRGQWSIHANGREAVTGACFIQESAIENLEEKRELYADIEPALGEDTVLASSTSFLTPSALQEGSAFAERILVGHPFNPPHLIPLVEVVGGRSTSEAACDRAMQLYASMGKRPIRLKKEVVGHLANRLQAALWREAVHAVVDGIADLADVDAAIAYGPGLRWALMGPHTTFHLAGGDGGMAYFIEHLGEANEVAWRDLGNPRLDEATAQCLVEGCRAALGDMTPDTLRRRRDRQLLALLSHTERVI